MKKNIRSKSNATAKGFTLVELLVVISIIGLLSSIVLSSLSVARSKARDTQRISDIHNLQTALELYRASNGAYPTQASVSVIGTWPGSGGLGGSQLGFLVPESAYAIGSPRGGPASMSTALAPLVSNNNIAAIPVPPGTTFYGYVSQTTANNASCDNISSDNFSYILFFSTENPQTIFKTGVINTPSNTATNLYCVTLQ